MESIEESVRDIQDTLKITHTYTIGVIEGKRRYSKKQYLKRKWLRIPLPYTNSSIMNPKLNK